MNEWKITVMGDWGREDALLAEADVIAGGRRLLRHLPHHRVHRRQPLFRRV